MDVYYTFTVYHYPPWDSLLNGVSTSLVLLAQGKLIIDAQNLISGNTKDTYTYYFSVINRIRSRHLGSEQSRAFCHPYFG